MNKCVLLSVRPQYCELIANGKKSIEIRKSRPKIPTPFKCYIYCTAPKKFYKISEHMATSAEYLHLCDGKVTMSDGFEFFGRADYKVLNRKVIGEFVCDEITKHTYDNFIGAVNADGSERTEAIQGEGTYWFWEDERKETCLSQDEIFKYGGTKPLYAWNISALQIYDKPRELSEFVSGSSRLTWGADGESWVWSGMTRPPQSWCYVEEHDGKH